MSGCGWRLGQQGFLDTESFNMCFLIARLISILSINILSYFIIFHSNSHSLLFFLPFFLSRLWCQCSTVDLSYKNFAASNTASTESTHIILVWFCFCFKSQSNQIIYFFILWLEWILTLKPNYTPMRTHEG